MSNFCMKEGLTMKFVEKNNEKIFTKNSGKDIIENKYNLLNKNEEFYEREWLYMRKTEDIVLDNVKNKIKVDEIVIECWYNICKYYNKKSDVIYKILGEN